jgi:hypothetical protein
MDEIKAKADQLQLFDEDYDPSVDQPGYRRDQDAHAPAAPTWADLRKTIDKAADDSVLTQIEAEGVAPVQRMRGDGEFEECQLKDLKRGDVIKVGAHLYTTTTPALKANDGGDYSVQLEEAKPLAFGAAAEQQNADATARGELSGLLEKLWAVHVTLSLGTLQTFTAQQLAVTKEWVEAYAADPEHCKIARPFFLPMPDATGDDKKAAEG